LEECRVWKEDMPLLNTSVIGIPVKAGHGCPDCLFSQERARNVMSHIMNVHGRRDNPAAIPCSIQRVFVSNLHGWWRVNTATEVEETTDEGLIALRHFNAEFDRLEQQNGDSDVGIYSPNIMKSCSPNSRCTCGSETQVYMDVEVGLGCSVGRNGMASSQGFDKETRASGVID
jgi:hypothetical protein